jgi:hypothetical protein
LSVTAFLCGRLLWQNAQGLVVMKACFGVGSLLLHINLVAAKFCPFHASLSLGANPASCGPARLRLHGNSFSPAV